MRQVHNRRVLAFSFALGVVLAACAREASGPANADWDEQRRQLGNVLRGEGITNTGVLDAMAKVPRHLFVPEDQRARSYEDTALPIGLDQTISQPFIVAYMTEALEPAPTDRVLEIGTGSGYQAAVLAALVKEVYSIEILEPLASRAASTLRSLGVSNVHLRVGNGYLGWPEAAPFDKIMVTAAPPQIPPVLVDQLAVGGVMVVPVGEARQRMTIVRKTDKGVVTRETVAVRFVPMVK